MADTASILTGGVNSFQTTAEHVNYPATDFISDGVVGAITATSGVAPMTGALAVNAQGSPNMTVAVTAGIAYVTATPTSQASQRLRAAIAAQNVTIAANATGGTRYDWIYVTISASGAAAPAANGTGVASITQSRSTSNVTDNGTPPTYGYAIAVVTVVNGAASIANASIAEKRVQTGATSGAGAITYAKLLSTIFSGQISTTANAGTAGGTINYLNLGGLKLMYGRTATFTLTASAQTIATITFPVTFITAPTLVTTSSNEATSVAVKSGNQTTPTTTGASLELTSTTGGVVTATALIDWIAIGV